ncbi:MAG: hypothetical protein JWO69_1706 [Thermoleophilia bacterium]|nr:hypothetical protein [Thermoleophilia bacterium]
MSNQSMIVKVTVWFMVFLMSVGFAALVVQPFLGGASLFGDDSGRGATEDLLEESRAAVREDKCNDTEPKITGERLERCRKAYRDLGSAYQTLAVPITNDDGTQEAPADYERNLERAGDAYEAAYELDPSDTKTAETYAGYLQGQGKANLATPIWTQLVKSDPENEDYLLALAQSQQGANELDAAIATLRSYLKKFPESGEVDSVKDQIESIQEQQAQASAGGAGNISMPPGVG